ncbi:MAG: glycerate kinase [Allosphingosinicella sp.]|uniref:glycerate kinase type-2 family protein n=1 Tax=Allosphingosinicella sp. TaxID=2823234 RepID=UPI003925B8CD
MRTHLEAIFRAGVDACRPEPLVAAALPPRARGRTICLAIGKAAPAMARAVERAWDGPLEGLVVAPHGTAAGLDRLPLVAAGHPVPDEASLDAATRLLALARGAGRDDLLLCLLSGGASALACLPGEGLTLAQKQRVTRDLLRSGGPVADINCVRRHLSRIKGGRLAAATAPAKVLTLAISDVIGDPPADIGSGPTVADPTTLADAMDVLRRHGVDAPDRGWSETMKRVGGDYRVLAGNRDALRAAAAQARRLGYRPQILGEVAGEAREAGRAHAALALAAAPGTALISGGELTVTVTGRGVGGPNQEYALAAAIALAGREHVAGLAADTDGIDGTGAAAGAFFGSGVAAEGAEAALADNDSGAWFAARGALFVTGPTGTNVNDLRILLTAR